LAKFEESQGFALRGSSLLFLVGKENQKVKIIDPAAIIDLDEKEKDEGYIIGLKKVIEVLEELGREEEDL
jgi:hypothetical protein